MNGAPTGMLGCKSREFGGTLEQTTPSQVKSGVTTSRKAYTQASGSARQLEQLKR